MNEQLAASGSGTEPIDVAKVAFDVKSIGSLALNSEEIAEHRAMGASEDWQCSDLGF